MGPPGFNTKSIGLTLALHEQKLVDYNIISAGELVQSARDKKVSEGQHIESTLKEFRFARDEFVIQEVRKSLDNHYKNEPQKHVILVGFPRTIAQGLALQKAGIIPDVFIILNKSQARIHSQILQVMRSREEFSGLAEEQLYRLATNSTQEYCLHLADVKTIYKGQYFEVDVDDLDLIESKPYNPRQLESLQEVADLINSRMSLTVPKRPSFVLVFGPPGSGRTTLGKAIARKYGMAFIATSEIIANDIALGGERIALGQVAKGESVPDMVMLRLLNERLSKVDCKMQGCVIDGFPKTPMQFDFLGEDINPALIVILQSDEEINLERFRNKHGGLKDMQQTFDRKQRRWQQIQEKLEQTERKFAGQVLKLSAKHDITYLLEQVSFRLEHS